MTPVTHTVNTSKQTTYAHLGRSSHLVRLLPLQEVDGHPRPLCLDVDKERSRTMITMNVDADTYLRWLSELANLWSEKGQEPSIVRRRMCWMDWRSSSRDG